MLLLGFALSSLVLQVQGEFAVVKPLDGQEFVANHGRARTMTDHGDGRKDSWRKVVDYAKDQVPLVPSTRPGPQGIGRLPALGFNSWNAYRCDINEKQFLDAAQLMIDLGLKDAGYEYVNIDDCWSWGERDPKTKRLRHDPFRFPEGINATAKKIHDLGLKIGIYSSAGTNTCAGYPASLGFEDIDAQTWADWGIDYLKYDNCNIPKEWQDDCAFCVVDLDNHADFPPGPNGTCPEEADNWCPKGYDYRKSKTFERYRRMKEAIDKTGRPMLYSLCQWGSANVQAWGAEVSQSWRSTGDIFPYWDRIKEILNENAFYMNSVDFYGHSDPDMLEVGNLDKNNPYVEAETRSHFALWAAMKSPLLIGTDLSKLSRHDLAVLANPFLLAFNQDPEYGRPAEPFKWGTNPDWTFDKERPAEFWAGQSRIGTLVLVLNTDDARAIKTVLFEDVPRLDRNTLYSVTDVWTGREMGCITSGVAFEIGAHDTAAIILQENGC